MKLASIFSGKKTNKPDPALTAPATDIAAVPGELIAVITAAIEAFIGVPQSGFIIRGIRRVPAWENAARTERQRPH